MASVPPPSGMSEVDYEAIEAAVTETVRGRWFLTEFARRNRLVETRQLLDAMSRIEVAVAAGQVALPSADPSIRMLIQRIKEIAGQLGTVASDMHEAGVDAHFIAAVDLQARAVAGLMRGAPQGRDVPPPKEISAREVSSREVLPAKVGTPTIPEDATRVPLPAQMPRMPRADLPPMLAPAAPITAPVDAPGDDPRLALLSGFDGLSLAKKLALFS